MLPMGLVTPSGSGEDDTYRDVFLGMNLSFPLPPMGVVFVGSISILKGWGGWVVEVEECGFSLGGFGQFFSAGGLIPWFPERWSAEAQYPWRGVGGSEAGAHSLGRVIGAYDLEKKFQ